MFTKVKERIKFQKLQPLSKSKNFEYVASCLQGSIQTSKYWLERWWQEKLAKSARYQSSELGKQLDTQSFLTAQELCM